MTSDVLDEAYARLLAAPARPSRGRGGAGGAAPAGRTARGDAGSGSRGSATWRPERPALTTLRAPGTAAEVPAALESLVEAGARQYTTHGHGSPVLLVHVATAPNAIRQLLPALPTEFWSASFAATWAACAAITVAYAPAQPLPAQRGTAEPGIEPDELMALAAQHGDEHVMKLTDTVLDVYARSGDPSVLAAATHCADLIEPPQ